METNYDPKQIEAKWYRLWQERKLFHGDSSRGGEPYCIVIPPPNVTGILHMGHALNNTIQDILVRWRRMQGRNVVWMPGTDHAGIATQNVVEKALRKEGKSREDLGR
ncbi:MAG: class I tRNA ligase family protein, partial [Kiritimatiellae bacterium]|nr:class I tRNA ligase family protein [Kiritimatiellia bacterium]